MNYNIPITRVEVDGEFLTGGKEKSWQPGFWYGVSLIQGQVIGCQVMLENGANWARLPLHILATQGQYPRAEHSPKECQAWDCFSSSGDVLRYDFLRGQRAEFLKPGKFGTFRPILIKGHYVFTIDYSDPDGRAPFAEDPEQHKQHHVFACEDGRFRARPNNMLRWTDPALYDPFETPPPYRAQRRRFHAED